MVSGLLQNKERGVSARLKHFLSRFSWPGLLVICLGITAYGFEHGHPVIFFNIAYLLLIISLLALENYIPHEEKWREPDKQNFANIAHTISSKGTVQGLLIFGGTIGLSEHLDGNVGDTLWPHDWPMWGQIILGLIAAEFGLYWAHRIAHEVPFFWRFHAIHHSVKRLWIINTGRFHFIDSLISIVLGLMILYYLGAPVEVMKCLSAVTAFIGMLTHCNVDMKFKYLSWVFNTPELHRWHHSKDLREGDKNYGENLMLWDHIFRSYFREPWRRPPVNIGIKEYMPERFIDQLLWPFYSNSKKQRFINGIDYGQ